MLSPAYNMERNPLHIAANAEYGSVCDASYQRCRIAAHGERAPPPTLAKVWGVLVPPSASPRPERSEAEWGAGISLRHCPCPRRPGTALTRRPGRRQRLTGSCLQPLVSVCGIEERADYCQRIDLRFVGLELVRPRSSGMERIPPASVASASSPSRIVVPKAVEADIPKRPMMIDEETFREGNPDGNHRQMPASEVPEIEIIRGLNRSCVLPQSLAQDRPSDIDILSSPRSGRNGLADIDGIVGSGNRAISIEWAGVKQGVNSRSCNVIGAVQRDFGLLAEMQRETGHKVFVSQRVVQLYAHGRRNSTTDSYRRLPLALPTRTLELTMLLPTRASRGV